MSSNLENDGLVGLQNDDLDRDGLAMVVNDNCEFNFEGKSYHLYEDYVQAKRSRTAGIFADSGMLASRLAIVVRPRVVISHRPTTSRRMGKNDKMGKSSSTIDLDAHLTHKEVMFGVPEVDDFGAMVERVVFDDVEKGTTTTSSYLNADRVTRRRQDGGGG